MGHGQGKKCIVLRPRWDVAFQDLRTFSEKKIVVKKTFKSPPPQKINFVLRFRSPGKFLEKNILVQKKLLSVMIEYKQIYRILAG